MGRCIGFGWWAERRGAPTVVFDPALTEEKPKYLWDLAVGKAWRDLCGGGGAGGGVSGAGGRR